MNRRQMLGSAGALLAQTAVPWAMAHGTNARPENKDVLYGHNTLAAGIRSKRVNTNTGAALHILEAGYGRRGSPCVVLLHGFPELAYTWRNQLLPLAQAGFHVIAPDLRGYGQSVTRPVEYEDDLLPYSMLNRVSDIVGLVRALGHESVAAVVGHDWGGPTAQWCARVRPDVFRSVVSMSTPFLKPPTLPLGTTGKRPSSSADTDMDKELAALPRPRKHYITYSATSDANNDMWRAPQGVHDLLRALFHFKSADWAGNKPFPLASWSASELAKMPDYYIMELHKGFAETMAARMPSEQQIANCTWMTEQDLRVYSTEFARTGFQGGLNYYRVANDPRLGSDLKAFSARTIDVPACYIGGDRDWATYQSPGAFEGMHSVCSQLVSVRLIDRAGHSLAEERPQQVNEALLDFLGKTQRTGT
ncbi:alpha/beta fold hydrolase [Steroidobacter cummioxidans]|uniref:alpha/beta fold hydrolase n=1 Tax=Steroidobacter cummioxidans TaxID=1803913 RepID=UPI0019D42B7E|nr:alpha/beta hydrolase [Steroidobacter cummioxidans]